MTRPLVSVVTATRDRLDEALLCVERVRNQSYRPLEHVLVSDGKHPDLRRAISEDRRQLAQALRFDASLDPDRDVPLVFAETGRCWSDELAYSPGAAAFLVAQMLASGELQMWLSDDELMTADHVESLVKLLENTDSDFVYAKAEWWVPNRPELTRIIGTYPPQPDQITNALYRTALLDYGTFLPGQGYGTDWHQISRWIEAGASYAMLDRVTFSHRADQVGAVPKNVVRQPLRGLGGRGVYAGPRWKGHPIDPTTGRLAASGASL